MLLTVKIRELMHEKDYYVLVVSRLNLTVTNAENRTGRL